jgi:putative phage-type endonuclease
MEGNEMEEVVQGSLEWLQQRAGHVTASGVEDVKSFGKDGKTELAGRKDYRIKLLTERLRGEPSMDGYVNAEMQRGIDLEPVARARYEAEMGVDVQQCAFVKHPTIQWFGASPDGLVGDDGLVEIKCPKSATHMLYLLEGKAPKKYHDQMIAQCMCTGRKWVDFVSFDDRLPDHLQLFVVRFTPTEKDFADTAEAVQKFLAELAELEAKTKDWTLRKEAA